MPTVKNKPSVSSALKRAAKSSPSEPVWKGPCSAGPQGGVTQGLLGRYLSCKERFRVMVVEGLRPIERFEAKIEFGNMWHACEESLATGQNCDDQWERLNDYVARLAARYQLQRAEIAEWEAKCRAEFPLYVDYWRKNPDVIDRTPLLQEQVFDVHYVLPSGRTVRLRGKWDSVDLIGKGRDAGVYLQENKTKSSIDGRKIASQLTFDLQTMMYLVALWEIQKNPQAGPEFNKDLLTNRIKGVRYNVVRRSAHKSVDSMLKKIEDDRADGRIGEWFARWRVEVSAADIVRFRRECLDPVLENLCDDWEWWEECRQERRNPFDLSDRKVRPWGRHFRFPYGIYNPIAEGGFGDLDDYLSTGNAAGLARCDNLFPELK